MEKKSPKIALRLLTLFFRRMYSDSVSGDCEEMYDYINRERGKIRARYWLWKQVVTSIPLFFIDSIEWGFIMFANYIKIAFRNMWKHKGFSFINISGLTIGMACCILILLWVQDELSYDRFHHNKNNIYRVISFSEDSTWDGLPAPLAPAVEKEIPGIVKAVRLLKSPRFVFKYDNQAFYEDNGIIVDPSFFDVFSFPLLKGNPEQALSTPLSVLISERMARKYFGDRDPMDKLLSIEGRASLKVSGIFKNVPANSHLQFEYVLPFLFAEMAGLRGLAWGDFNFKTYVQLVPDSETEDIIKKINESARQHGCPQVVQRQVTLSLQPLLDMYLHPLTKYDTHFGNIKYVRIFSLIALCILLIASINFVNLTTARSENRAKEIGIRKVVGGRRNQLIKQFFGESLLLAFIALAFSLFLVRLLLPPFNNMTGKNLVIRYFDPGIMLGLFLITLLSGILAGLYPALYLSSFKPVDVIKGNSGLFPNSRGRSQGSRRSGTFRKVLVVMQFSVSITLIICTLIVYEQLNFIKNKSWKLEDDLIVHVPVKENIGSKYEMVKTELLKYPQISGAALKDCLPTGSRNNTSGVYWQGKNQSHNNIYMETTRVSFDYFKTMDMEMAAGRDFSREFSTDVSDAFILNETAVKVAGIQDPVGKMFQLYQKKGVIIGVVKDTYFKTMKRALNPQVYYLFTDIPKEAYFGSLFIRIKKTKDFGKLSEVLKYIENTWNKVNSVTPFEYYFLDETIDDLYKNERRLGRVFTYFAFLAIFISCLGLFGLSSFLVEKRTKEIGIRKTLGASVKYLVIMLSKDFSKWVLLSNMIAIPLAWYAMKQWLQNFAYQTGIGIWIFILSGSAALIIAFLTVVFQSLKAANTNPIDALRYE